jgi:hypothetical protein
MYLVKEFDDQTINLSPSVQLVKGYDGHYDWIHKSKIKERYD